MFHYPNHDLLYHTNQYQQQCPILSEHSKNLNIIGETHNSQFEVLIPNNVGTTEQAGTGAPTDLQSLTPVKKRKKNVVKSKKIVDTSNFSIEERLVAAVWVHERKHTKSTMSQIKHEFRQRFGRDSPAKNTLLVWERKLFSTGSVHDAPRPGRPVNRRVRMAEVSASLRGAPALSLRARALLLRLPRTTLRTILRSDLAHTPAPGKQLAKQNVKRQLRTKLESQAEHTGACASFARHTLPCNGYT